MTARLAALTFAVILAAPAVAQAAKVKVFTQSGSAFTPAPSANSDEWYRSLTTAKATVFCRSNAVVLAAGWRGAGGFVGSARVQLMREVSLLSLDVRQSMVTGALRPLAVCARGPVRAQVKRSTSGTVRCGAGRIALGVAAPPGTPFQNAAAFSKPSGRAAWTSNLGDQGAVEAVCVAASAFRSVTTVRKAATFATGAQTATVAATCPAGRRAIGWGYEAAVMEQNIYRQRGITNTRDTAFASRSEPRGARGWRVEFRTPDGQGAKTPAAVTAYVTCAIPR